MALLKKTRDKFENAGKKSRKTVENEVDLLHYTVIHHIDHAIPEMTTAPGQYYEVSSKDFEPVVADCKDLLPQISISSENAYIFDDKILSYAVPLGESLKETRILHKRNNVTLRADAEMLLADEECYVQRLEEVRNKYNKQLAALCAKR